MKQNNYIQRKLTTTDQILDKQEYLGIDQVIDTQIHDHDVIVYKYGNGKNYRGFLKLNVLITPSLLALDDFKLFQQEWRNIVFLNNKTRMYAVKKPPNFKDIDLEINNLIVNEKTRVIKEELVKEYENCSIILEYYLDINANSLDGLLDQLEYMVNDSKNYKYLEIVFPLKTDNDYIYENLVLGGLDIQYNPDNIVYNQSQSLSQYVKYLYVVGMKPKQKTQFWQSLTRYPNVDFLLEIEKIDGKKAEFILNKAEDELEEKTNKNKAQNRKLRQEAVVLNQLIHSVVNSSDTLVNVKFMLKFSGNDLSEIEKQIKTFKKDNDHFIFMEKLDNYEGLEKYYLGVENNIVPEQTLTLNIMTKGVGLFFSTYIQNDGILLCNKSNTITIVNREKVKQEDGQSNYNEFVCGTTGSGKSTLVKKFICYTMLKPKDRIINVDVSGEYIKLCQFFDGQVINLEDNRIKLNPFDLIVDEYGIVEYKKVVDFLGLLSSAIKTNNDLKVNIENYLLKVIPTIKKDITLQTFYDEFILQLNNNIIDRNQYSDLFVKILENIINNYPIFNGKTNVNLDNRFITFNLKSIKEDYELKMAINYIISRLVNKIMQNNKFSYIKEVGAKDIDELNAIIKYANEYEINLEQFNESISNIDPENTIEIQDLIGKIKKYVQDNHPKLRYIIDEAHNLLNDEVITEFLLTLSREGRKFSTGLLLATQTPSELLNGSTDILKTYKRSLWEMIPYKYFLKVNDLSGLNIVDKAGRGVFTNSEINFLYRGASKGQGFVMYNGQNHLIGTVTSERLLNIFDGGVGN